MNGVSRFSYCLAAFRPGATESMWMTAHFYGSLLIGIVLLLTGCSGARLMMPTPNVLLDGKRDWYVELSPELSSTEVPLYYFTDRSSEQNGASDIQYGYGRSASIGFGTTVVDLGVGLTWEELLQASQTQRRFKRVVLELHKTEEITRLPETPVLFKEINGRIVENPDILARAKKTTDVVHKVLSQQLELTPRKEIFLYVHGFHTGFDDAAYAMAELWHFLGRIGVPVIYSWPAGYPGMFGYTYDRESSEFTVYHLRQTLKFIASFPEVEKIHIVAHSRGTDIALDALRELTLQARAVGIDPRKKYKIHNLVLAAPDLDVEVVTQRAGGDKLGLSVNRLTVYASPADKAIGIASKLFASPRGRVGTLGMEDMNNILKSELEYSLHNFTIINYSGGKEAPGLRRAGYGHAYFRSAPTVSSDLVLMLRDDLDAGTPNRPLEPLGLHFWQIPPGYPGVSREQ